MSTPRNESFADYWERALSVGVRRERLARGMSQSELAEKMSALGYRFHQATVYKVESGERRVTASEARGLAQVLDVPQDLLFETETKQPSSLRRRALLMQADGLFERLLAMDAEGRRLRFAHEFFKEQVGKAGELEAPMAPDGEPELLSSYLGPLVGLSAHEDFLDALREQWQGQFAELAGDIIGIIELGPKDNPEAD